MSYRCAGEQRRSGIAALRSMFLVFNEVLPPVMEAA
jgi:hypothetical protein